MPVAGCEHWMCKYLIESGQPPNDICPLESGAQYQAEHGGLDDGSWTNLEANTMKQALGNAPEAQSCPRYTRNPVAFHARIHALRTSEPEKEPA